jgi:hypothetical protein
MTTATQTDYTLRAATHDPTKNLALIRAAAMSDDDRYQVGFDHGFNNRGMRGSLANYPAYLEGWRSGYRARF